LPTLYVVGIRLALPTLGSWYKAGIAYPR
jgi:hypothetical protein